jgi:hypothetical protein
MRELDHLEQGLKAKQQEIAEGLKLVDTLRKMLSLGVITEPKPNGKKNGVHAAAHPGMSAAAKRKQKEASKAYWAKVKSGEIKRKGYKADAQN